jgi:O-antigen/teichoic acid export membrane protein
MRDAITRIILWLYSLVFRREPGSFARAFIKNIIYVSIGLVVAKAFSLIFQVYAGRVIGITEYGKYTLISSLSNILYVPMMIGLGTAFVKYLSEQEDAGDKKRIMSTALIMMLPSILIFSVAFYAFSGPISAIFSVKPSYVQAGVLLAAFYSMSTVSQKTLQGLNEMKKLSTLNIITSISWVAVLLLLAQESPVASSVIIALMAGYLAGFSYSLVKIRGLLAPVFDRKWAKIMLSYASINIIATFAVSVGDNISKIFINMYLTMADIGLYQAYSFSTVGLAGFFSAVVVTVFFPASSRSKNKAEMFRKIAKMLKFIPVLFMVTMAGSCVVMMLYGSEYAFSVAMAAVFTLYAVLVFIYYMYDWFAASCGMPGIKIVMISTIVVSALSVVLSYVLTGIYGVFGAAASSVFSFLIGTIFIYFMTARMLARKPFHDGARKIYITRMTGNTNKCMVNK